MTSEGNIMSEEDSISVVKYVERILCERERALQLTASALDKRLDLLNELRSGVLTRVEYEKAHEGLIYRIGQMEKFQSRMIGVGIVMVFVVGVLGAVVGHIWK